MNNKSVYPRKRRNGMLSLVSLRYNRRDSLLMRKKSMFYTCLCITEGKEVKEIRHSCGTYRTYDSGDGYLFVNNCTLKRYFNSFLLHFPASESWDVYIELFAFSGVPSMVPWR